MDFVFGIHRCMGNRLAEMQPKILWEEIMLRFDKIEIVGEVERTRSPFVRGYTNMPVVLHPKAWRGDAISVLLPTDVANITGVRICSTVN